jgi:hypothetical protein
MVDAIARPYFLWDADMTLDQFRAGLSDADPDARAYLVGKLMRQAKPDDVLTFVRLADIVELWPRREKLLGRSAPMWRQAPRALARRRSWPRVSSRPRRWTFCERSRTWSRRGGSWAVGLSPASAESPREAVHRLDGEPFMTCCCRERAFRRRPLTCWVGRLAAPPGTCARARRAHGIRPPRSPLPRLERSRPSARSVRARASHARLSSPLG